MFRRSDIYTLAALAIAAFCAVQSADAQQQGYTIFAPPTPNSQPSGITAGPDGNIWFTQYAANNIGRITPGGIITEFAIPTAGSGPYGITTGPDGNLWFTEQLGQKIGRITPAGVINELPIPSGAGPVQIVTGSDGNLWFTEFSSDKVVRLTPAGVFTKFQTPTAGSGPRGIAKGPDGNIWFTEFYGNKIGRITPAGDITEFPVSTPDSQPTGIISGPDGNLWFTEIAIGYIARITLTGSITQYDARVLGNNKQPLGIVTGDDGNIWFAPFNSYWLRRMIPDLALMKEFTPTQTFVLGNPREITTGPDGNLWFTANNPDQIVRYVLPQCHDVWIDATYNGNLSLTATNGSIFNTSAGTAGEAGEPDHAGVSLPLNSAWCRWTAPATAPVTFDTTGSQFDTTLAVYTGESVNGLTPVVSNNDISSSNKQSRATFSAVKDTIYSIAIDGAGSTIGNYVLNWAQFADGATTVAAVLPTARSVTTRSTATAFGSMINTGQVVGTSCAPRKPPGFPGIFSFQTTNASNQLSGTANTPVDIPAGGTQSFVFAITPTRDLNAADIAVIFQCSNKPVTNTVSGLNTFLLSASTSPSPDLVAIGATPTADGILNIPGDSGSAFFGTAAINIGAAGSITATIDDNGANLLVTPTLCQSNPSSGACINPATPAASATVTIANNQTVTFAVFVTGAGNVPFDPAHKRLFLRLKTGDGVTRGATSVAVRTQ